MDDHHRREPLTVDRRFMGPPGSGNGGYVAGRLASYLTAAPGTDEHAPVAVEVTLRLPPPLGSPIEVAEADGTLRATFEDRVVAEARRIGALEVDPIDPVAFAEAQDAEHRYGGLHEHPFPECFACGTARRPPDALGLRPGLVDGLDGVTACTWVPDVSLTDDGGRDVRPEMVWAALDCPGGWTVDIVGRPAVLGRITAQVDALPYAGERCVVMGRLLARDGRKAFSATTLYDGDGRVLGRAAAVWIEVDPATAGRR